MMLPMKYLRWVFLVLYVLVVVVCVILGLRKYRDDTQLIVLIALGLMIMSQAIFIFGTGTIELCKPIKRRRLLLPTIAASLMIAILAGALSMSLAEFFIVDTHNRAENISCGGFLVSWLGWGILFYVYTRKKERFQVMRRLATAVFSGSLIELLAAVPLHLVVSRRPGCFVGLSTMMGIIAGIYVMFWAFGPGIALLFIKKR
jgi:hypothetical protein